MPLYVVATPIGTLEDIGRRATRVLAEVDAILAEDTRHTLRLLEHLGVRKPLLAYHDHSSDEVRARVLGRLEQGESLALVSDAGTPAISDPGYRLVRAVQDAGHAVHPIPGPSALTTFLCASGLPTNTFRFVGFAPRRSGELDEALQAWLNAPETTVLFESPQRLVRLLTVLAGLDPGREVAVGRELTKIHEEIVRGPADRLLDRFRSRERVRGEVVVGISGASPREATGAGVDELRDWAAALAPTGIGTREASRVLAQQLGVAAREAYQAVLKARGE